ncbi:MAG: glycosyltransferase [Actinomycetota bacterium]|nr:glycosyltransferase [Actinomycetota bacterium]
MSGRHLDEAWRWSRRHRAPLVFYFWDIPPWRLASGRPDPVFELGARLVSIPRLFGRLSRRPGYFSRILYALKHTAEVWVASRSIVELVEGAVGRCPTQVPYCYDSDRFTPGPECRDPELIVTVSRLISYKGQGDLIRAVATLPRRPRLRVIGRGPEEGKLRALAASLDIRCSVETDVTDEGIVEAYRTAGVVVCPSHFEGFGLTGLEALACGARVVATDIPPHREFLGVEPVYYAPGDTVALAAALETAAATLPDDGRRADLSALTIPATVARFAASLTPILERST